MVSLSGVVSSIGRSADYTPACGDRDRHLYERQRRLGGFGDGKKFQTRSSPPGNPGCRCGRGVRWSGELPDCSDIDSSNASRALAQLDGFVKS